MARFTQDGNIDYSDPDFEAPEPGGRKDTSYDYPYYPEGEQGQSPTPVDQGPDNFPNTPGTPGPSPTPIGGGQDWSGPWDEAKVNSYYASRGVTPNATSPAYWVGKWGEWGQTDPAYFMDRLSHADEFGGGGAAEPGGGGNRGNPALSNMLTRLLSSIGGQRTNPFRDTIRTKLSSLMDEYSRPVTAEDPIIAGQTQAYEGKTNRAIQDYREMAAERAHAEGTTTGAFDSQIGNAIMAGGRAKGDFQSQLMGDELKNRRSALSDVLSQSQGSLNQEESSQIQREMAAIDGVLRSMGLDTQNRGLDIQQELGEGSLANQRTGMANQDDQFYDKLSADQGNEDSQIDQILLALGLK